MLPIKLECSSPSPDTAKLQLLLDPQLFWFKGHFPGQPVLPGVAQIHWAVHYAREHLGLKGQFVAMQAIKFQSPVTHGQTLELNLQWSAEKELLKFSYFSVQPAADLLPVSSGKIRFSL